MTTTALPTPTPTVALTEEQRRIVEWDDGPVVVIAGAGTGKTKVIVERVRRLLETQRRTSLPGAAPRPDLQRQGRHGAAGAASTQAVGVADARPA